MFDKLHIHMLWMCLWLCPYHDTDSLIDQAQAFGSLLRIPGSARQQTTVLCSG